MKNKLQFKIKTIGIILLILSYSATFSQVDKSTITPQQSKQEIWTGALVNAAGDNKIKGVNVFFRTVICNEMNFLLLKFVNTNDSEVLIEWANGVYTANKKWVHDEKQGKQKEISIKQGEIAEGICVVGRNQENNILKLDLDELSLKADNLLKFAPSYIEVTKL